jgi:hypothetical protein
MDELISQCGEQLRYLYKKININGIDQLRDEYNEQKEGLVWKANLELGKEYKALADGRYRNGKHGTRWCYFTPSVNLIEQLEHDIGHPIFKDTMYLWDYLDKKILPPHLDTPDSNSHCAFAVSLPLVGSFQLEFYDGFEGKNVVGSCVYQPGEAVIINNLSYHHGGKVLSTTRLGLHLFLDYPANDVEYLVHKVFI